MRIRRACATSATARRSASKRGIQPESVIRERTGFAKGACSMAAMVDRPVGLLSAKTSSSTPLRIQCPAAPRTSLSGTNVPR